MWLNLTREKEKLELDEPRYLNPQKIVSGSRFFFILPG